MIVVRPGDRAPRLVGDAGDQDVILEVAANAREIDRSRDAERAQMIARTDPGEQQEFWGVDRTSRENHLMLGMHFAHTAAMPEDQAGAAPGLDRQALRHCTGQDRQARASRDWIEIGGGGAVTARARDAELVPGRAGGLLAADVGIEWKALADRCGQERRGHGIAVRRVLERQDVLRAVAAVPVVGPAREGLGAPEIRQQVQKAPAGAAGGDPPVIAGCMAVLVGERID